MSPTTAPRVSVVVSTYNRVDELRGLIGALEAQTLPADQFEVVIVDDGSTDATPTFLAELADHPTMTVTGMVNAVNSGPAVGRNNGVKAARADVIAFTDDDCRPVPEWLEEILRAVDGHDDRIVVGRVEPLPGHTFGPFTRTLRVDDAEYFQTANTTFPRAWFERAGGFDESYRRPGGEDTDLGLRLLEEGAHAVFAERALVRHAVSGNDLGGALRLARRWIDIGRVVRRHPQVRDTLLHRRLFWKRSHPPTLLAVVALAAGIGWRPALLGVVPWLYHRGVSSPAPHRSRREHLASLPGVFLVDVTEVATMVRASVRGRTLLL